MAEPLRCVPADSVITGWDFSTGAVKCLAFDLDGQTLAEVRLPTDLWTRGRRLGTEPDAARRPGPGQHAGHRRPAARPGPAGTTGSPAASRPRITPPAASTATACQVRRAICWNDHTPGRAITPAAWQRLGGQERVKRADRRPLGDSLHAQPSRQGRGTPVREPTGSGPTASCRTAPWRPAS